MHQHISVNELPLPLFQVNSEDFCEVVKPLQKLPDPQEALDYINKVTEDRMQAAFDQAKRKASSSSEEEEEAEPVNDMLSDIIGGAKPVKEGSHVLVYSREPGQKPKLKEFEVISLIGQGSISKVYLVFRKTTNQVFAMKCISKANILKQDLFANSKLEKDLLITVSIFMLSFPL